MEGENSEKNTGFPEDVETFIVRESKREEESSSLHDEQDSAETVTDGFFSRNPKYVFH